jgi:hypothetical protein
MPGTHVAGMPDKDGADLSPYQTYDRAIHNTARMVEKSGRLPVVLDDRETLFQLGEAPDAALYLGWYSLGKYTDKKRPFSQFVSPRTPDCGRMEPRPTSRGYPTFLSVEHQRREKTGRRHGK